MSSSSSSSSSLLFHSLLAYVVPKELEPATSNQNRFCLHRDTLSGARSHADDKQTKCKVKRSRLTANRIACN